MAAALERLRKRSEFLAVAASNRRWTTPGLVLQARSRPDDGPAIQSKSPLRIGFTATKKVGNAVMRNRARRRLKAAVHDILMGVAACPSDLVVVARQGTATRVYSDLKDDLATALNKLGIIPQ